MITNRRGKTWTFVLFDRLVTNIMYKSKIRICLMKIFRTNRDRTQFSPQLVQIRLLSRNVNDNTVDITFQPSDYEYL